MFQLAHFSDPHIAPLPEVRPWQLANKRFLGWLSWKRRRQRVHRREILDALAADLQAQAPDHVVVTGDITNIALPEEFRQAGDWLGALGAADWISVVPGNHDAYVALPWSQGLGTWAAYMSGDDQPAGPAAVARDTDAGRGAFPFLRRRGPLAIVGLSTALPTPPGSAAGALGAGQLDRLAASLEALGREGRFRCVLLHHPPQDNGISWRKRLIDAEGFRAVLREPAVDIATAAVLIDDPAERDDPHVVKAVADFGDRRIAQAQDFLRALPPDHDGPAYHHVGIYAYRREALARFVALPPSARELERKLEQLRAMDDGLRIDLALIDSDPLGVDTPGDLVRIRELMAPSAG